MKIAICDDNKYCNEVNERFVKEYLQEKDIKAIVQSFNHGNQLLKSDERFDIVFLDIDMPGKSGMEVI
ncbi:MULTISPECIES: response regulator [unclassified Fusibacter]|uniref:response regulator n=1 Tax=unclassified Fusibacter TaxID=2624464 RepID=UPI0013E97CC0|nr:MULTISPECIES: response regulator [unclassified Fusibacter]MCK8058136.1 response regulator [Fusibacter sp. A2]NPE20718.1 response regulator [Fusibacter sp. A1]